MINGVIAAIRTAYDEAFTIYTEPTEQELTKPCFLILCSKSTEEHKAGTRREKSFTFTVHYYPESDESTRECQNVMEKLYRLLKIISTDAGKLRGKNLKSEIADGILKFEVTYMFFVLAVEEEASTMDELQMATTGN